MRVFSGMKACVYLRVGLLAALYFALGTSLGFTQTIITTSIPTGRTRMEGGRPDTAYSMLKATIKEASLQNEPIKKATALKQAGLLLYHEGSYGPAIANLLEAKKIFKQQKNKKELARTMNALGLVYYFNKQASEAMAEFLKALNYFKYLKDDKGIGESYGQIGHIYEKRMMYDSSYYYQNLALAHLGKIGDSASIAFIYENIASNMEDQQRYDSSLHYYQLSLDLSKRFNNQIDQIDLINNLGDIYRKTGRYDLGLQYARKAMQMSLSLGEQYQLGSAYRDIGRSFAHMQRYDSAYYYIEKARVLQKEIYKTENARQTSLMQVHYDTENKNLKIIQLHAEQRLNFTITVAAIIILALVLIFSIVLFKKQRSKTKAEKELREAEQHLYQAENGLLETELHNKRLEESKLKQELELKGKELSSHILHLIQKNEALERIKKDLNELLKDDKRDHKKELKQLLHKINISINQDTYWSEFRVIFEQVHQSFFDKIRAICDNLTANDLRLIALLKMNLHTSDITTLLGVSQDSLRVIRYRLRKKLKLEQGENLSAFLQSL